MLYTELENPLADSLFTFTHNPMYAFHLELEVNCLSNKVTIVDIHTRTNCKRAPNTLSWHKYFETYNLQNDLKFKHFPLQCIPYSLKKNLIHIPRSFSKLMFSNVILPETQELFHARILYNEESTTNLSKLQTIEKFFTQHR